MLLFFLLAIILILLLVVVIGAIALGGTAFVLIFGDVIVCAAIIAGIMYLLFKRKKN